MDIKAIGEKIKQYRKLKGLTQEELAKNSGLSTMSIRRYESGERIAPQETLLKIAKALGVHLRDLADNSWLEEFEQQHPDANERANRGLAVIRYLEEMGFTISSQVLKWHWENASDPPEERVQIADEILTVLSKDGHTATFTDAEFEELQAGAKEAIEGRFYKKVLEQQKK